MGRNEKPKTISSSDLHEVSSLLKHFADRYENLAFALQREVVIDSLTVRSWEMMKKSLNSIQRAVNRAYEAFDEAKIANSRINRETRELGKQAVEADRAATPKKKSTTPKQNETK